MLCKAPAEEKAKDLDWVTLTPASCRRQMGPVPSQPLLFWAKVECFLSILFSWSGNPGNVIVWLELPTSREHPDHVSRRHEKYTRFLGSFY